MTLINLYSNKMTDVVAMIDGQVVREFAAQNSHVETGSPIVELVNETIPLKIKQADSDISEAEAMLTRAKNTYARYEQLIEQDAISLEKFDEAKAQLRAAEARLENFLSQKDQLLILQTRQTVTSPISGEILRIYKPQGSYVTMGMPVALVGNFDKLYFNTSVSDKIAANIQVNQNLQLHFPSDENFSKAYGGKYSRGNKGSQEIFPVLIKEISPPMNEPAKMRQVIFEIDNSSGLLEPGFYDDISISSAVPHKCLAVPLDAMIDDSNRSLFVVLPNGILQRKNVETGMDDGTYIEILSGLSEGEIVVISETDGLTDGISVDLRIEKDDAQ